MAMMIPDLSGLGQGIQEAGSALGQALQQAGLRRQQQQEGAILQNLIAQLPQDASMMDIIQVYSKLPESQKKNFANIASTYQKSQPKQTSEEGDPKFAIENMLQSIGSTGPLAGAGGLFNPDVRARRQYFNSLALELEKRGAAMVGKGTLNQRRFEYLKSTLPSANKTQAANIGALKAWADELKLDIPELNSAWETIQGQPKASKNESQFTVGQKFNSLPESAPENAVMKKGKQRFIMKKGKWRLL